MRGFWSKVGTRLSWLFVLLWWGLQIAVGLMPFVFFGVPWLLTAIIGIGLFFINAYLHPRQGVISAGILFCYFLALFRIKLPLDAREIVLIVSSIIFLLFSAIPNIYAGIYAEVTVSRGRVFSSAYARRSPRDRDKEPRD